MAMRRGNTTFLTDPLHAALEAYTKGHDLPHFRQCVVCFSHVFDKNLSDRRGRGYEIRYAFFPVLPLLQPSGEAAFFHDGEDGAVPFPELKEPAMNDTSTAAYRLLSLTALSGECSPDILSRLVFVMCLEEALILQLCHQFFPIAGADA